ncbi:MAG: outer membrane beta-barrel protein, partial [Blastochloris sp.]|nr:outer membrane beta-barrel protein [Blastochloris sp.]
AGNGYTFASGSLYAKYQFTDIFSLAGRASYLHNSDEGSTLLAATSPINSGRGTTDLWSYTLTAGFNLLENLLVRAEYRVDAGNDVVGVNGDDLAHTVAFQAVYTF